MGYFRAILMSQEKSLRAFNLCKDVITENPGNYTGWFWRRVCMFELKSDLAQEMEWLYEEAIEMSKVYQYWQHRRVIAEAALQQNKLDVAKDISNLYKIYQDDCKNFHMWTYRMWLVETTKRWDEEMVFMSQEIVKTPSNNSLWNYRYFLHNKTKTPDEKYLKEEVK